MYYVYYNHIESGREDLVGIYDTMKEAVQKITVCYKIDEAGIVSKYKYYYFIKKH